MQQIVPPPEAHFPCCNSQFLNAASSNLWIAEGVPLTKFTQCTGLPLDAIDAKREQAIQRGWLMDDPERLQTTELGQRFLNDAIALFMP